MSSPLPANCVYTSPPRETTEEACWEAPPEESKEKTKAVSHKEAKEESQEVINEESKDESKEVSLEEVKEEEAKEDEGSEKVPVTDSLRDIEIAEWREKFFFAAFGLDKDGQPLLNRPMIHRLNPLEEEKWLSWPG